MEPTTATPIRQNAEVAAPQAAKRGRKRKPFLILGAMVLVALAATGIYLLATANQESTDDAQIEADVVPLAARISGQVFARLVADNQRVKKGDVLLQIDDADFAARARQADAELGAARAQAAAADAQVRVVQASAKGGFTSARAAAKKADLDLARTKQLVMAKALPTEQLDHAQQEFEIAQGRLDQSTPFEAQINAAFANAELAHARVKVDEAALELAQLQLTYTKILAPEDGVVSRVSAQPGQWIQVGQPIAELVPDRTYIVANYKETQVGRMRPGQPAIVHVDAFPGVELVGRVESISGGTGARFSLLPPDNATGNFVKVVQRVPVRIAWTQPPALPLNAGLSVDVTVNVKKGQ